MLSGSEVSREIAFDPAQRNITLVALRAPFSADPQKIRCPSTSYAAHDFAHKGGNRVRVDDTLNDKRLAAYAWLKVPADQSA